MRGIGEYKKCKTKKYWIVSLGFCKNAYASVSFIYFLFFRLGDAVDMLDGSGINSEASGTA